MLPAPVSPQSGSTLARGHGRVPIELQVAVELCPGSSRQEESHHTDRGNGLLVWILREADTNTELNMQGFYWSKSRGKKMSHSRLRGCSDYDANLIPNEVKGE